MRIRRLEMKLAERQQIKSSGFQLIKNRNEAFPTANNRTSQEPT